MAEHPVEYYLNLPYTINIVRDVDQDYSGWFARVVELPGCMTNAETFEELGGMIEDAKRAWIETALEDGRPVPEPRKEETYSGKFVVRVAKSLHRELVERAEQEGVSLNAFVNIALAKAINPPPVMQNLPEPGLPAQVNWPGQKAQYQVRKTVRDQAPTLYDESLEDKAE